MMLDLCKELGLMADNPCLTPGRGAVTENTESCSTVERLSHTVHNGTWQALLCVCVHIQHNLVRTPASLIMQVPPHRLPLPHWKVPLSVTVMQ
eukprot:scaffold6286_cov24-Tisochrysis_lutea.AAC.2